MARAYVDTSCLVSVLLNERGSTDVRRRLGRFDELLASTFLEAELRATLHRERVSTLPPILTGLTWILPNRPLGPEITRVLAAGYVRGADCWHLATALYAAQDPASLAFLTLDQSQAAVGGKLGFAIP